MNFNHICVLGLGYIGLPTASTLAALGVHVTGVDNNSLVVETLQNGGLHIQEPGLRSVVQTAIRSGNLQIASEPCPADAYIIAVPTPFYDDKRADLRAVINAAESIVPHLQAGSLVILESTSPPLTTTGVVQPILERSGLKAGPDFHLAYSPERVLPGQILRELVENARVIGGVTPASAEAGRSLYSLFVKGEIVLTDATTAEMVKLMENTCRDINIAIANEFSRLADRFGVDIWEAIAIANRHPRVKILRPGPGVGGHCIGVDPWFLVEAAPDLAPLIRTARQVNDSQPHFAASLVERALLPAGASGEKPLAGQKIAALGLAFKPDVDDIRESPAVEVVRLLVEAGADVATFEPFRTDFEVAGARSSATLAGAVEGARALLLLVAHTALVKLHPDELARLTPARLVIDTVAGWPVEQWQAAGFQVFRLGDARPHVAH